MTTRWRVPSSPRHPRFQQMEDPNKTIRDAFVLIDDELMQMRILLGVLYQLVGGLEAGGVLEDENVPE